MAVPDDPFATQPSSRRPSGPTTSTPPPLSLAIPPPAALPSGSGTKTPRRVQWTSDSHIVAIRPPSPAPVSPSPSTLDEAGLEQLRSALERHRSLRDQPRPSSNRNVEVAETEGEDYDYRLDTAPYDDGYHPNPRHSMAGSSEAGSLTASEADLLHAYPPHENLGFVHPSSTGAAPHPFQADEPLPEDVDPSNIEPSDVHREMAVFVDPGERDGMPSAPPVDGQAGGRRESDANTATATALVRAHTGRFGGGFMRQRKALGKGVGGIVSGVGKAVGVSAKEKNASNLPLTEKERAENSNLNSFASRYPSTPIVPTVSQLQSTPRIPPGGGVLASLLALYDNGSGAGGGSGVSTPASSRPGSLAPSDAGSSDEEAEREFFRKRDRERARKSWKGVYGLAGAGAYGVGAVKAGVTGVGAYGVGAVKAGVSGVAGVVGLGHGDRDREGRSRAGTGGSSDPTTAAGTPGYDVEQARNQPNPKLTSAKRGHATSRSATSLSESVNARERVSREGTPGGRSQSPTFFETIRKTTDRWQSESERPKAARSGAGVFGALIQGTGNLTGAATPAASTLVPNAKRPGYQLSRYSLPDVKGGDAGSIKSNPGPASRPGSMFEANHSPVESSPASANTRVEGEGREMHRAITHDGTATTPGRTPTLERANHPGQVKIPKGKPFSLKSLGSMTHLPLTPGGQTLKAASAWMHGGRSQQNSPTASEFGEKGGDYFGENKRVLSEEEIRRREWEAEKKKRRKAKEKKKQQEIFIIQHVAAILARQQFIMKLARAFMMFGAPTHRLEAQLQATARVLDINCQVIYIPGTCLISFGDDATHTSETKFLKQATGLDLGLLLKTHELYWDVVHDKISVEVASRNLDVLMTSPPHYKRWHMLIIGGMCSFFIAPSFNGSFVDALAAIPLGALLILIQQLAIKNDLYSNVFEITVATISSFIAAALASTNVFCYTAVASQAIVLILPGYIVLCGSLELASRNITSGSVRIGYSVIYSLFLGFGLSIGAVMYERITGLSVVGVGDYQCSITHAVGSPWYRGVIPDYFYFLTVPCYSFFLSLRQSQPIFRKETLAMVLISCCGWTSNHFAAQVFVNRADITSMIGSFVVGLLGNIWGRFSQGQSFIVMVVGILFQLPSGLSNGGLFQSISDSSGGLNVASQLLTVSIGLTVGLFASAVVVHPFGGGRRRGTGGLFSF